MTTPSGKPDTIGGVAKGGGGSLMHVERYADAHIKDMNMFNTDNYLDELKDIEIGLKIIYEKHDDWMNT